MCAVFCVFVIYEISSSVKNALCDSIRAVFVNETSGGEEYSREARKNFFRGRITEKFFPPLVETLGGIPPLF